MSEMIERVSKAILEARFAHQRGRFATHPEQDLDLARAAIEAMREPTSDMLHAGATDSTPRTATNTLDRMYETVANIYRAAMDAALSPGR